MSEKLQYNTRRKAELLEYLKSRQGCHLTANDIRTHFLSQGQSIGTATIYRQLDHLLSEGIVQKYTLDETSAACYEYVGPEENCHPDACFHCKCVGCGKLIHLHCHELEKMQGHLAREHGFHLEFPRTVLYGRCRQCGTEGAAT